MPDAGAKGSVVQGYNCQAAVEATAQIIVAADVTDEANDKQQAQPMFTQGLVNNEQVPGTVSMDTGYFSETNVMALTALGCQPLIPPDRQLHGQAVPMAPRGRLPAGLSVAVGCAVPSARGAGDGGMLDAKRLSSRCSARSNRAAAIGNSCYVGCDRCVENEHSSVPRTMF